MFLLADNRVDQRFAVFKVDVETNEAYMSAATALENAQQQTLPLVKGLYVVRNIRFRHPPRWGVEYVNGPRIGQPLRPALGRILALDGAQKIASGRKP